MHVRARVDVCLRMCIAAHLSWIMDRNGCLPRAYMLTAIKGVGDELVLVLLSLFSERCLQIRGARAIDNGL